MGNTRRQLALVTALAVSPVLFAGLRGTLRGWYPTGDNAFFALRSYDVLTKHHPLLGTWSSASAFSDRDMNHPGPLHFDLLALPVRLLGPGPGVALGMTILNAATIVAIAWLLARRGRPAVAYVAMAGTALLAWSMGSEMLYDPWSPHAALLPFGLCVVAAWCAVDGDLVALPVMVFAGSAVLQLHLSYVILVPGIAAVACGLVALQLLRGKLRGQLERRTVLRWGGITLLVAGLSWVQPVVEQLSPNSEGNMTRLLHGAQDDAPRPKFGYVVEMMGDVLALPPIWLPPSFGDPAFLETDRPMWLVGLPLVALVAALVALGWRAWRRGSTLVATGAAVCLATMALGFVTLWRMPIRMGPATQYTRFLWPLGMVVWVVLTLGVWDELRLRLPERARVRWPVERLRLAAPVVAAVVAAVAAVAAAVPTVDNSDTNPRWSVDAIHELDDDILAALDGRDGAVLVTQLPHANSLHMAPAVMAVLQDAGIPFFVDNFSMSRHVSETRFLGPGDEVSWQLTVTATPDVEVPPDDELVAEWDSLSRAEEEELEDLTESLSDRIEEHGLVVTQVGRDALEDLKVSEALALADDPSPEPAEVLGSSQLQFLLPFLDPEIYPQSDLNRWTDLNTRRAHTIRIYLRQL